MIVLIKNLFHPLPAILLTACFLLVPATSFASMQDEISHLLNYIETSDCVFIRNNTRHTPKKAVAHIKRKYNYLKKRITTTDDFIEGAATRSSLSGKPYMSICDGREIATADWLRAELLRYRSHNAVSSSLQKEKSSLLKNNDLH
jgi:hypothetical protein